MSREDIERLWNDPRNRRWGFYRCKADPRVIVPRRIRWMGWTVNIAHPSTAPVLIALIVLLVLPVVIVRARGGGTTAATFTIGLSVVAVSLICAYLASPGRWTE